MFRVVTRYGQSRLYKTIRYYSNKNDQQSPQKKKTKLTYGGLHTIGAITLITGATLSYAICDPGFREWLNERAPFSDDVIKFVTRGERGNFDNISLMIYTIKASFFGGDGEKQGFSRCQNSKTSRSKNCRRKQTSRQFHRNSTGKESGADEHVAEITGKKIPQQTPLEILADLEIKTNADAKHAIEAFSKSIYAVKSYNNNIEIVEESVDRIDKSVWNNLREKAKKAKDATIKDKDVYADLT